MKKTKYLMNKITINGTDGLWVEVRILKNKKRLKKAWEKISNSKWDNEIAGFYNSENITVVHRKDKIGTIYLCKKYLNISLIAHECLHAVIHYLNIIDNKKTVKINSSNEEFICYCLQYIVKEICNIGTKKNGEDFIQINNFNNYK